MFKNDFPIFYLSFFFLSVNCFENVKNIDPMCSVLNRHAVYWGKIYIFLCSSHSKLNLSKNIFFLQSFDFFLWVIINDNIGMGTLKPLVISKQYLLEYGEIQGKSLSLSFLSYFDVQYEWRVRDQLAVRRFYFISLFAFYCSWFVLLYYDLGVLYRNYGIMGL